MALLIGATLFIYWKLAAEQCFKDVATQGNILDWSIRDGLQRGVVLIVGIGLICCVVQGSVVVLRMIQAGACLLAAIYVVVYVVLYVGFDANGMMGMRESLEILLMVTTLWALLASPSVKDYLACRKATELKR